MGTTDTCDPFDAPVCGKGVVASTDCIDAASNCESKSGCGHGTVSGILPNDSTLQPSDEEDDRPKCGRDDMSRFGGSIVCVIVVSGAVIAVPSCMFLVMFVSAVALGKLFDID